MISITQTIYILANDSWYIYNFKKELIIALVHKDYEVIVISGDEDCRAKLKAIGAELHVFPLKRRTASPLAYFVAVISLIRLLRKDRPKVVYTFNPMASLVMASANIFGLYTQIMTVSGFGVLKTSVNNKNWLVPSLLLKRLVLRFLIKSPKVVFVQNAADYVHVQKIRGPIKKTIRVMGSGVDLDLFKPVPRDYNKKRILFAARFLLAKGIMDYIGTAKRLQSEYIRFAICGLPVDGKDGMSEQNVLSEISGSDIKYIGYVENMHSLYKEYDILVLPSQYGEGIPKSLLEGAAAGLVLVAYDNDGVREIVVDEVSGRLIITATLDILAQTISELCSRKPKQIRDLSMGSRRLAEEKFSVQEVNVHYVEALSTI